MSEEQWHYVVGSESKGPFQTSEMEAMIARGQIGAQTLVWHENLSVWEAADRHFDMTGAASGLPAGAPDLGRGGLYAGAPARGFGEALVVCLSKYAKFSGRASRSEFWYFVVWQFIFGFITGLVDEIAGLSGITNGIASLVFFIPSLAVSWRRIHDIDRSGWWIGGFYIVMLAAIIAMVPVFGGLEAGLVTDGIAFTYIAALGVASLVYSVVILVFFCTRGTLGPNRFG